MTWKNWRIKREKDQNEWRNFWGLWGGVRVVVILTVIQYDVAKIEKMGALSVCSFAPFLSKVSKEHSCLFLSANLMEVSGAAVELTLDAKGLFVFLSEVPQVEQVLGTSFGLPLGRTGATSSMWK